MATLVYDFRVVGLDSIDRAFASVESRLTKHNAIVTRATGIRQRPGADPTKQAEKDAARAAAKAERAAAKLARDTERARQREIAKALREEERLRVASARSVAKQQDAITRAAARRTEQAAKRREQYGREVRGAVGGSLSTVGRGALAATGLGGGAWLTAATYGAVKQEENVRRLLINSRGAGQSQLMTPEALSGKIRGASIGSGIGEEDITAGLSSFVARTGDLDTGVKMMATLAETAAAAGANFEDLAGVSADLMTKFDVRTVEDMQDALAGLVFQGKAGAFELRDMADQFPKIGAMAKSMGMGGKEGLRKVGALAQIVRGSTGNAETASFALDAMTRQLVSKGADMGSGKAFGGKKVNVFKNGDPTQGLRDVTELIPEILAASNGNLAQLQETFGGEGMRGMNAFLGTFRAAGGGAAGTEAVRRQITESTNAGGSWDEIQTDAKAALLSTSSQLEILNTKMKAAVETDLLPALKELIPQLTKMAPMFGEVIKGLAKFIGWATENPWTAITGVVAAKLGQAMVEARIADAVSRGVSSSMGAGIQIGVASLTIAALQGATEQAGKLATEVGMKYNPMIPGMREDGWSMGSALLDVSPAGMVTGAMKAWDMAKGIGNTLEEAKPGRTASGEEYTKIMEAAIKFEAAADKMAAAGGGATAPGTLNRGPSPTAP